ncbi:hypothetical protein CSV80_11230 [Sporosarcina sp. P12(2017)]|uniref:hypothetical protein n=1 Tax=unclassified Sporosarcina TaxID=2647733 RepID=UPI000C16C055|nr:MULTISPECIES: hypothetical protein [unclassified Sporosarcina]PIC57032.1 hypothetical protein CSV81_11630 [Sporosarcina sp. P10]PIC60415.1 hypothetical protein CSV80_11230 [Sporosarcina sp. P12(2017)]
MSEKTKRIVSYGVMGLAVTLLLLGFIIGFVDKGKKNSVDDNSIQTPNENEEENIWQYTSKEGSGNIDVVEEKPEKNYLKIPEEVSKNPTQSDMFSNKDLEKTTEIANEFALKFHEFDKASPVKHLESVEGLLDQGYISYLRDNEEEKITGLKDVKGIVSRKVLSVEIKEPVAPTLIAISWDAVVISEVIDSDGKTRKDTDVYSLMFEKDDSRKFQIVEYYLNYDDKR